MCVTCVTSASAEMTLSRDTWRASMDGIQSRDILAVSVEKFAIARIIWGDTSSLAKRSALSAPGVTVSWRTLLRWPDTWDYARYPHVVCVRSSLLTWISWGSTKNPTGNEKPLPTPSLPNSKAKTWWMVPLSRVFRFFCHSRRTVSPQTRPYGRWQGLSTHGTSLWFRRWEVECLAAWQCGTHF